jgi:hypothetical protein
MMVLLLLHFTFLHLDYPERQASAQLLSFPRHVFSRLQVNVTVAIANWEGVGRKASARDEMK